MIGRITFYRTLHKLWAEKKNIIMLGPGIVGGYHQLFWQGVCEKYQFQPRDSESETYPTNWTTSDAVPLCSIFQTRLRGYLSQKLFIQQEMQTYSLTIV
jgi:hypothetical protein